MSVPPSTPGIRDDREGGRFILEQHGRVAELVYDTEPGRIILVHTEVPDELSGEGIGGDLVSAAVDRARDEDLQVVPWCPFARRWLEKHTEVADTVTIDWSPPPSAG